MSSLGGSRTCICRRSTEERRRGCVAVGPDPTLVIRLSVPHHVDLCSGATELHRHSVWEWEARDRASPVEPVALRTRLTTRTGLFPADVPPDWVPA